MKWILACLAAAVIAAWAWHWYTQPGAPPVRARTPAPRRAPNIVQHITCPLCKGLKVLLYNEGTRKDDCPLCINASGASMGYRDVPVPPGYQICPNCQGMGLVVVNSFTHPPKTDNCVLCGGTGVIAVPK